MEFIPRFILLALLIACNAFFVASEVSLIRVRKTRIDELAKKGDVNALRVQKALNNLSRYLSATQLGITLASLALGWIGEPTVASFLSSFFTFLPTGTASVYAHTIAWIVGFALITFIQIIFGELVPKYIGLQKAESVSLFNITFLSMYQIILNPVITLLTATGTLISRLIGLSASSQKIAHSEEEIKMILAQSAESGLMDKEEAGLVSRVFTFSERRIATIMIAKSDILAFNILAPLSEVISTIKTKTHSRFFVYDFSLNGIIGFIHIKDIYMTALNGNQDKTLVSLDIIKQVIIMTEDTPIHDVFTAMQNMKTHVAVVVNQGQETVGVVTLENIVESIVGHIDDEIRRPLHDEQMTFKNWE